MIQISRRGKEIRGDYLGAGAHSLSGTGEDLREGDELEKVHHLHGIKEAVRQGDLSE